MVLLPRRLPSRLVINPFQIPASYLNDFDQRAVILLNSSLTEEAAAEVLGLTTAHAIWTALETAYNNSSVERIHSLRDSLRNLSKGTSTVSDYGRQFKGICDKLAAIGQPVDEMDQASLASPSLSVNVRTNGPLCLLLSISSTLLPRMLPTSDAINLAQAFTSQCHVIKGTRCALCLKWASPFRCPWFLNLGPPDIRPHNLRVRWAVPRSQHTLHEPIHEPDSTPSSPYSSEDDNPPTDSDDVSSHGAPPAPPATAPTEPSYTNDGLFLCQAKYALQMFLLGMPLLDSKPVSTPLAANESVVIQSVGINHKTTAPYTPQQNGISERKNRVLKEMVNSMLSYSGLSQGFWGEAMAVLPKAFRFYVIEPNDSVAINSIIDQRTLSLRRHGSHLSLDQVRDTDLWVEMDLQDMLKWMCKTTFLNGKLEEEVYMNQPLGFILPGNENKVDLTKEFLSSRFSMKDIGEADVILVSTPMDTYEKLMPNRGLAVSQLEYSRVIGCLMYAMTCTRPDIAFVVGKLSRYNCNLYTQHGRIQRVLKYLKKTMDYRLVYSGYPLVLEGYTDASWISNTEDNSSTSGWVFLLGGGAISWASNKQTCITGSTMESKFVALAAAGKETECAATLAKAYSQMHNRKSRHLGVRHSMIRELITNGVVSIEFVRSQQNLADHLTKGLAKDLVIKSAEGM
ncbi:zinc finger, CCHC-type containing protein [Tanacetum coccineum]